jgi:hypothetical protein
MALFQSSTLRWTFAALLLIAGCGTDDSSSTADGSASADTSASADSSSNVDATGDTATSEADANASADTSTVVCKPASNTGCPTGQHCIYDGDTIACVDDGEHDAGEACDDGKGCKVGICVKPQSGESRCAPFCNADIQCASNSCNPLQSGKGKVCDMGGDNLVSCSVLTQNCKDAGKACYATPKGFGCLDAGKVAGAEACNEDNDCVPGYACIGKSTLQPGLCRKICRKGGGEPSCDSITAQCSSLFGDPVAGYCGE